MILLVYQLDKKICILWTSFGLTHFEILRVHLVVSDISLFMSFSLHFSYCKELVSCLPYLDYLRKSFFCCEVEIPLADISFFLLEFVTALLSCTVAPGKHPDHYKYVLLEVA